MLRRKTHARHCTWLKTTSRGGARRARGRVARRAARAGARDREGGLLAARLRRAARGARAREDRRPARLARRLAAHAAAGGALAHHRVPRRAALRRHVYLRQRRGELRTTATTITARSRIRPSDVMHVPVRNRDRGTLPAVSAQFERPLRQHHAPCLLLPALGCAITSSRRQQLRSPPTTRRSTEEKKAADFVVDHKEIISGARGNAEARRAEKGAAWSGGVASP